MPSLAPLFASYFTYNLIDLVYPSWDKVRMDSAALMITVLLL